MKGKEYEYLLKQLTMLRRYETLKDQGRLLELPCAVGDEIFVVWEKYRSGRYERGINTGKFRLEDIPKLGKRVFVEKAAAEARLLEMKRDAE